MLIFIFLMLLPTLCLSMDKPLGSKVKKEKKEVSAFDKALKGGTLEVIKLINKGVRLTPEEFRQFVKNQDSIMFWLDYVPVILTTTKLTSSVQGVQQPASLVSQATRVAAQLPSKATRNFPDPIIKFYLLLQREKPDLKGLEDWFIEYIKINIDKSENILKIWKQTVDYLSIDQSKKLLVALVKPWFKKDSKYGSKYVALGTNMIEALVEYQCSLRTALVALLDKPELKAHINKISENFIEKNRDLFPAGPFRNARQILFNLFDSREFCKKYSRNQLLNLLGISKEEKIQSLK